jgi:hypothetical protein
MGLSKLSKKCYSKNLDIPSDEKKNQISTQIFSKSLLQNSVTLLRLPKNHMLTQISPKITSPKLSDNPPAAKIINLQSSTNNSPTTKKSLV